MIETIKKLFAKKEKPQETEAQLKDLLRENLNLVNVDIFYIDDPAPVKPEERKLYLKKFHDMFEDKIFVERLKYLINKQARLSLQNHDPTGIGTVNINGIATVLDDFKRLADSYEKENVPLETINKYKII